MSEYKKLPVLGYEFFEPFLVPEFEAYCYKMEYFLNPGGSLGPTFIVSGEPVLVCGSFALDGIDFKFQNAILFLDGQFFVCFHVNTASMRKQISRC